MDGHIIGLWEWDWERREAEINRTIDHIIKIKNNSRALECTHNKRMYA